MNSEKDNDIETKQSISDEKTVRTSALLSLLFLFAILLLILDYTFPTPKVNHIRSIMTLGYWVTIFLSMFLITKQLMPHLFPNAKIFKYEYELLFMSVLITSILLALNIITGGGIPGSPYLSFLSSFPIFCVVLLFEPITFNSCLKGVGIFIGTILIVYFIEYMLNYYFQITLVVDANKLDKFMFSSDFIKLTLSILAITVLSNLFSIYFAAREKTT